MTGRGRGTGPASQKEGRAIEPTTRRRTHTSNEVKARYNKKTYQQYAFKLRKIEDAATIEKIEAERSKGYSASEAIKRLIEQ